MASAMVGRGDVAKQFSVGWRLLPSALDYEYSACCMQDYDLNSTAFFVTVKTPTA